MSAADPLEWIKHTLERLECELLALRNTLTKLEKMTVELEVRERERDRIIQERHRELDMKLKVIHLIIPTGIFGVLVWVWQYIRGTNN